MRPPCLDFVVDRHELQTTTFQRPEPAALQPGQARLQIDRFTFTANNITYAVVGDALGYWRFFPAEGRWGRIPVWGFGTVIESQHPATRLGDRYFGYVPMSTELIVQPRPTDDGGFADDAPHRRQLPGPYNAYVAAPSTGGDARGEAEQMLLRPLFFASFWGNDFLEDNHDFGAEVILVSSASSKTAIGLARLVSRRRRGAVIGLTSPRNLEFVERLGCYDRVVPYDAATTLAARPAVYFDVAGDAALRRAIHTHFGAKLACSIIVGGTHAQARDDVSNEPLPGPAPIRFPGPAQAGKRVREWGAPAVRARTAEAWDAFVTPLRDWLQVREERGAAAVERVYREVLAGDSPPNQGHVLSLLD